MFCIINYKFSSIYGVPSTNLTINRHFSWSFSEKQTKKWSSRCHRKTDTVKSVNKIQRITVKKWWKHPAQTYGQHWDLDTARKGAPSPPDPPPPSTSGPLSGWWGDPPSSTSGSVMAPWLRLCNLPLSRHHTFFVRFWFKHTNSFELISHFWFLYPIPVDSGQSLFVSSPFSLLGVK